MNLKLSALFLIALFLTIPAYANNIRQALGYPTGSALSVCVPVGNSCPTGSSVGIGTYWGLASDGVSIVNTNSGNVGIGSTSPGQALDVNGTVRALNLLAQGLNNSFQGGSFVLTGQDSNGSNWNGGRITLFPILAPTSAPNVAVNATSGILNGTYYYEYTYINYEGETRASPVSSSVSPSNQQVNLTGITVSTDPSVIGRNIYRSPDGTSYYYITTIPNNTATTYTDNLTVPNNYYIDHALSNAIGTAGAIYIPNNNSADSLLVSPDFWDSGTNLIIGTNAGYHMWWTGRNKDYLGQYNNIEIGYDAGNALSDGATGNNLIGRAAGQNLQINATDNTMLGNKPGTNITTGNDNLFLGAKTGENQTSGNANIIIGSNLDNPNPTGNGQMNIAGVIFSTGLSSTGGTLATQSAPLTGVNTGIGTNAPYGTLDVEGTVSATFFGRGIQNVGIGTFAPTSNFQVIGNIGIGTSSSTNRFQINTGTESFAIAAPAYNSFFIGASGDLTSTGAGNSSIGYNALTGISSGADDTALGDAALQSMDLGSSNVAVGYTALFSISGNHGNNAALGAAAGRKYGNNTGNATSVDNSLFLGTGTTMLNATGDTNENVIGNLAQGLGSNTTVIGNSAITLTAIPFGNVGIGTTLGDSLLGLKGTNGSATVGPVMCIGKSTLGQDCAGKCTSISTDTCNCTCL